ncbi:hypothetical protein VitviT2T_023054 [Vitis vinifera]|uniref:Neprosin PEP catalytic domain-containing protein n=1 Tax=Vitis vinifera TaxID=29760 RepID=A0ABY9DEA6_VITVI|nr:hypothetical protein VitviT2T_023054 [Vitis vinifera]
MNEAYITSWAAIVDPPKMDESPKAIRGEATVLLVLEEERALEAEQALLERLRPWGQNLKSIGFGEIAREGWGEFHSPPDAFKVDCEGSEVRVQTETTFARDLSDGYPKFVKAEGALGLYKCLVPFWGCQIPYALIKFASFGIIIEYKDAIPTLKDQCNRSLQLGVSFADRYGCFDCASAMTEQLQTARFAQVPFDLSFNFIHPDSDQIPCIESGAYAAYNNKKSGKLLKVKRYGRKRHEIISCQGLQIQTSINESGHQHGVVYVEGDKNYGVKATINVWEPKIQQPNEFSLSQLWILRDSFGEDLNSIEADWQVSSDLHGHNNTRLFTHWTSDACLATTCYSLLCSGFIPIDSEVAMGKMVLL